MNVGNEIGGLLKLKREADMVVVFDKIPHRGGTDTILGGEESNGNTEGINEGGEITNNNYYYEGEAG
jgi:hypothetical protein